MLDYDKMIFLDPEYLAEGGIKRRYKSIAVRLREFVSEPAEAQELIDNDAPSYFVDCNGAHYTIYDPTLQDSGFQCWGRATHVFFKIVNDQLVGSEYRFYAINGGNDLGGTFLKPAECTLAQRSLPNKLDWPYFPTLDDPWYGQFHS